jgi:heme/copper-type cytochrome/quinol oxidase subunit 4
LAYIATIWCIKIAVNLLYMHVSRSTRYHKWTLWSLIFICVAGLIVFFHEIFGIWPLADRFAQGLVAGSINAKRVRIRCSSYVINMVTNIILFVQPFVVIKTVRNRALRGGLYFVFGLALVDIAMSIVPIVLMFKSLDQDRDTMMIILCAQTAIGIMIATTPGLARPVLRVLTRWGQNNLSSELLHFTDDLEPHGLGELDPPLPTDGQEFVTSAVPEVEGIVSDKEKECHIKSFADLFACMKSRLARLLARKPKLPVYNRKSSQAGETTDGSVC